MTYHLDIRFNPDTHPVGTRFLVRVFAIPDDCIADLVVSQWSPSEAHVCIRHFLRPDQPRRWYKTGDIADRAMEILSSGCDP